MYQKLLVRQEKKSHPSKSITRRYQCNPDFSEAENKGFSFFHFGGPLALADPYRSDSLPADEDVVGDLNKGVSFEEYKLFASTRRVTFSILGC